MTDPLSLLFAILILVPGLLIPLYVITRMVEELRRERRGVAEKVVAGGTIVVMLLLMGITVYAAREYYAIINTWAASAR